MNLPKHKIDRHRDNVAEVRRTGRAERTRRALVESGRRALAAGNFDHAHISELVQGAGVSIGSFYTHFADKTELFAVITSDVIDELASILDSAVADVDDPIEAVVIHARTLGGLGFSRPDLAAIIAVEGYRLLDHPDLRGRISRLVDSGIRQQRLQPPSLDAALDLITGIVIALLRTWHRDSDRSTHTRDWTSDVAEHLLAVLGSRDSSTTKRFIPLRRTI
ncbi:TetR/AcrR family transcriptional regulator [Nocardia salmonicida]|uniref:TetR/AcrR family transcriptional regulator n=1 Tax=Nocardia salmonicida TaxID=53431 RepID=UPI002E29983E|nr:TetR/AcrR family transcriptional regulator [Nocardia salmonicida]